MYKDISNRDINKLCSDIFNNPYFTLSKIEKEFKGNVPFIIKEPSLRDYNLPLDAAERIDRLKKQHDKKIALIKIILWFIGYIVCTVYLIDIKNIPVTESLIISLITYGLISVTICAIFFEGGDFLKYKPKTKFEIDYFQYLNDSKAYKYWKEMKSLEYWMQLDGHQFEDAVAQIYRKQGYKAIVSKQGGDGGIDIVLTKDNEKIAVQCKAHNKAIGPSVARDLFGTMISQGYRNGIIVSRSGFTEGTRKFVAGKSINLVTMVDLLIYI